MSLFKIGEKNMERIHINGIDRHFYINDAIDDPEDYIDMIDSLYQGKPNETIYIHLNTPGGRLDIAMQLINAIKNSDCNVVGIADGQVASAGSLILFSCPNIAIMPYSYVMLHDGSEGAGGKLNENLKQAMFSADLVKTLYNDIYFPFFTKEEINEVLNGKDMWVTSDELIKRVQNLQEEINNEFEEEVQKVVNKKKKGKNKDAEKQVQK